MTGSRGRARWAWSASIPKPPRSIRCRRRLCGVSLAVAPGEACYIPCGHRKGDGLADCPGQAAATIVQIDGSRCAGAPEAAAGRRQRAEDRAEPEIRLPDLPAARHPRRAYRRHDADVLCAGRRAARPWHGRTVANCICRHTPIAFSEVAGKGKDKITFDCVPVAEATQIFRRRCRRDLAPAHAAEAASWREKGKRASTRRWSGRWCMVLADMERAGITIDPDLLRKLSNDFAQAAGEAGKARSTSWRARSSISARPSSWATSCSAR